MNLKSFNPMKIKIKYTRLPKQKLPSFQMQGELRYDEYGNVIGTPYLMGQAGIQSGSDPFDNSWDQAPAGAINPGQGGLSNPVVGGQGKMFPTIFPKPLVYDMKNPYGQLAINQKNNASRNVMNNLGKDLTEQTEQKKKQQSPFTAFDYLSMASTVVDYANQAKKAKQFDRNLRKQAFDITGAASPEFEGNYDINTGMFQPYRIFNPNEGMTMAEQGGELNNTMKIRITKGPQENMAYGGQSNYGLDLGRKKVYTDMEDSRSESVGNTLTGVPRYMANIEAEGGETVYGDMDGDGGLEHMKISGPRHSQGGVPLNVPEGSFVFSDTKKMKIKDPAILAKFGKSMKKGGITPAQIAKQYDINKYKAIMEDPNADPLAKATAQLMVKNYESKLGQLALVQEGMKGFPGGIPQVAQNAMPQAAYGGYLPRFQTAGPVSAAQTPPDWYTGANYEKFKNLYTGESNREFRQAVYDRYKRNSEAAKRKVLSQEDFDKAMLEYQRQVYTLADKYQNTPEVLRQSNWDARRNNQKNARYRSEVKGLGEGFMPLTDEQIAASQQGFIDLKTLAMTDPKFKETFGKFVNLGHTGPGNQTTTIDGMTYNISPVDEVAGNDYINQSIRLAAEEPKKDVPKTDPTPVTGYRCNPDGSGPDAPKTFNSEEERKAAGYFAEPQENCSPGKIEVPKRTPGARFDFTSPDKLAMFTASINGPKANFPVSANLSFRPNRLALQDWQAQAQNLQQSARAAQETLGTYQPAQGIASNYSFLQGETARNIADTIARTDAANVDRFNNFEQREGARKDFVNQFNRQNMADLYDKGVATKEAFRQESINAADRFAKSYANAWNNRMNLGLLNKTNPIYNIDPRSGNSFFMNGYGPDYFSGVANRSTGFDWKDARARFLEAQQQFPNLKEDTFFRYNYPGIRSLDRDGDNVPDSRSGVVYSKKGGQVNPLVAYLLGGFSFDPRDY
jgi:hypothetical protein